MINIYVPPPQPQFLKYILASIRNGKKKQDFPKFSPFAQKPLQNCQFTSYKPRYYLRSR